MDSTLVRAVWNQTGTGPIHRGTQMAKFFIDFWPSDHLPVRPAGFLGEVIDFKGKNGIGGQVVRWSHSHGRLRLTIWSQPPPPCYIPRA